MKTTTQNDGPFFSIPAYHAFLPPRLARQLLTIAKPHGQFADLMAVGDGGGLETAAGLRFLTELYRILREPLSTVMKARQADRAFLDPRVKACHSFNTAYGLDPTDLRYQTTLGLEDNVGRVPFGPLRDGYHQKGGAKVAHVPKHLQGPHVTLFGPPDSAKMAVNAMNAFHRVLPGEPKIVADLLQDSTIVPMWGADDEDSKTPLRAALIDAAVNLTGCHERTIKVEGYPLAQDHLSVPIKRFPGLAIPSPFLFLRDDPIPLHLYDFALHLWANKHNPAALSFYVPKLENEEEAQYVHTMIAAAEQLVKKSYPQYELGSVRLMIVLENPRAIVRTHEIMDALHPYFVGASLGWHDFLASTARLFKEDGHYRIPVKADPNIVIKYIKASHSLLAEVVGSRGGIKVGGMYGILPIGTDLKSPSFQMALKGFFRDVFTQLKRDLTGFWVAHPDFVRLGIAIVEAWQRKLKGDDQPLRLLVEGFFADEHRSDLLRFLAADDVQGLDPAHPAYVRSLIVADIKESDFIANNHPDEIRYNVFQSLQYLTDWLTGNGCVALPTVVSGVPVRVMDDLATAERSRWEVWHELRHGRFSLEAFLRIAHEEMRFIRKDLSDDKKIVQVKFNDKNAKWYPVAFRLMITLMTANEPPEFASELLLRFTLDSVRKAEDPWQAAVGLCADGLTLPAYVERWLYYFEKCGSERFATVCAKNPALDIDAMAAVIHSFSEAEVVEAASFHGDIGEAKGTLDLLAQMEQSGVSGAATTIKDQLIALGKSYLAKHGFKFLVSAQGKTATDLLTALQTRIDRPTATEFAAAKDALFEIAKKRTLAHPLDFLRETIDILRKKHGIKGLQVALTDGFGIQTLALGYADEDRKIPATANTLWQIASLSKSIASAFASEFFAARGITLSTAVQKLLVDINSDLKLNGDAAWLAELTVADLLRHTGLNMHYVKGFASGPPKIEELVRGGHGYEPLGVIAKPGSEFHYSGGGYLLLEYLLEKIGGQPIARLMQPFLATLGLSSVATGTETATGYFDNGKPVTGGCLHFPALAAGFHATAGDVLKFLAALTDAYHSLEGAKGISHDTAVNMLYAKDGGCLEFMGCKMGLGVFVAEMGDNAVAIHQGANEGFRALYFHCFKGPDRGKGFVVLCNGDNRAVPMVAELAHLLIKQLKMRGLSTQFFMGPNTTGVELGSVQFDATKYSQEQIVNRGYKELLFAALEPTLPPPIERGQEDNREPYSERNCLTDAKIIRVSDQRFARAENLISPYAPVFDPTLYCPQGKVMDSWETARHSPLACDYLELALTKTAAPRYARMTTAFHHGNHAPAVRILARSSKGTDWQELLPKTKLEGHSELQLKLPTALDQIAEVRVEMFPDGGLTRLGLYEIVPDPSKFPAYTAAKPTPCAAPIPNSAKPLTMPIPKVKVDLPQKTDWAATTAGGRILRASNEHYGPAVQVISPLPPLHMFDGLESARSRNQGHFEEVDIELGKEINLDEIVFDYTYFVNNNPLAIAVFALQNGDWQPLTPTIAAKPYAGNLQAVKLKGRAKTIRVRTYPDGGINRIHVYGN